MISVTVQDMEPFHSGATESPKIKIREDLDDFSEIKIEDGIIVLQIHLTTVCALAH